MIIGFIPFSALFFSWAFLLNLFAKNASLFQIRIIFIPLITATLFVFAVYAVSNLFLRDKMKSQIFTAVIMLVFFSYGDVFSATGRHQILFYLSLIFVIVLFFMIFRLKKFRYKLSYFLNVIAVLLIIFPILRLMNFELKNSQKHILQSPMQLPSLSGSDLDISKLPDIYYIVPEDYSSADVYKKYFHSDLSEFTDFLRDKGFFTATEATSNYPKSFLSLASSLNMEYLDYLSKYKKSSDQTIVTPLIENSIVMRFLKSVGYRYYQMGSWWGPTHYNHYADDNLIIERKNLVGINEYDYAILEASILNPFINRIIPLVAIGESESDKRARIIYQFDEIPNVVKIPGPKFVFIHVIAPHEPYVFGGDCNFISIREVREKTDEENYVNQTKCINRKLENAISAILNSSSRKPVILLQSDEGAPFLGDRLKPKDNWKTADINLLQEKFPILSAYYLPDIPKSDLYPSITPVNSFRMIFNKYFNTHLPILTDQNYIFPDTGNLYEFREVTNEINSHFGDNQPYRNP